MGGTSIILKGLLFIFTLAISGSGLAAEEPAQSQKTDLLKTANELFERGEFSGARTYYERYLKDNPKDARVQAVEMMIAECALESARLLGSAAPGEDRTVYLDNRLALLYSRVLQINPDTYLADGAQFRINEIFYGMGAWIESSKAWDKFLDHRDASYLKGEALKAQSQTLAAQGRWEEAGRVLEELSRYNPAYDEMDDVRYLHGVMSFYRKDYEPAVSYLQKMSSTTAAGLYYLGKSYLALGRGIFGAQKFHELIRQFPGASFATEAEFLTAESNFAAQDYPAAIKSFSHFVQTYPTSALRWAAHYKIGYSQFAQDNFIAARESLQTVLGGTSAKDNPGGMILHPDQSSDPALNLSNANDFAPWALYLIGESYLKEKRYREASFVYGKMANAFVRHPFAANAMYKLSWCLAQDEDYAASQTNLRQLLALYPASPILPYAHLLLGNILNRQGKFDEAARAYQRSVDISFPKEIGEAAAALTQRANYQSHNYGALISGYHLVINNFAPTANLWRAWTYLYIAEGYFQSGHYGEAKETYQSVLRLYPASDAAIYAQDGIAWSLFKMGRFAEALKERERLAHLRGNPTIAAELLSANDYEIGNALFNMKKYNQALEQFERFSQDYSTHPMAAEALYRAGLCYAQLGYHGQSIDTWQKLRRNFSNSKAAGNAGLKAADTYFRAAKYDNAIALYQEIVNQAPKGNDAAGARIRIAQSYYNSQRYGESLEAFQTLIVNYPDSKEAREALEFLTALMDKPEMKHPAYDRLHSVAAILGEKSPLGAEIKFRIAQSYFDGGDYANAAGDLENMAGAYLSESRLPDKEYYLAESYYQISKLKEAAGVFERLIKNFPDDPRAAFALFRIGNSYFKLERFLECGVVFERLMRDFPKSDYAVSSHFNAALCYKKAKQGATAENLFASYINRYPAKAKETNARQELADLFQEEKKYRDALAQLEALRNDVPANDQRFAEITFQMASLNLLDGNDPAAVKEYEKLLSGLPAKNSWRTNAAIKLGDLYEKSDQWQAAVKVYEEIIRDAAKSDWVKAATARIEYLKSAHK
ncbi:MAG: tetratricopeptide repeat protein [Elusimicrobiota bacterium]